VQALERDVLPARLIDDAEYLARSTRPEHALDPVSARDDLHRESLHPR
jgi:hypothetical protein